LPVAADYFELPLTANWCARDLHRNWTVEYRCHHSSSNCRFERPSRRADRLHSWGDL